MSPLRLRQRESPPSSSATSSSATGAAAGGSRLRFRDLLSRRRPKSDGRLDEDQSGGAHRLEPGTRWQHGDGLATRLLHAVLVGALVSGPAALCWVAATRSSDQSVSGAAFEESVPPQTRDATVAAAAAQRLVLTWLTASTADKAAVQAQLVEQLPSTVDLPEKRPVAPAQMWVGEVDERAPGRFQVVVATTDGPLGTAYFAVPIRVDAGVAVALGLPARTRPPSVADSDRARLPTLTAVSTDDPAFQTAAGYVTAYLTGSAELDRWTGPNAHLTAVLPRACNSVRVDNVQTLSAAEEAPTTRVAVVATATCQVSQRPSSTSQYGLVLQVRDGRWEVAAEDPALLLDPTSSPSTTVPSASAPSAPTSTPR